VPAPSKTPLSKSIVERAQVREGRYALWDSMVPGFGIRINLDGSKTFLLRYRPKGGGRNSPRRFVALGRYGIVTVEDARKMARQILAKVAAGEDPAAERQEKRVEMKIEDLIDVYEAEGCFIQRGIRQGEDMKPKTKAYTIARLRHHVVPLLGRRHASSISASDIERFVRDVASGKTASDEKVGPRKRIIVRGGDGAARKVLRDLSAVFRFAVRREIVASNPVDRAVVRKTDNSRSRYLTIAELKKLGQAFDKLAAEGASPKAIAIARLWALTGCRRSEIEGLKWSEVDLDRGLLVLEETKTGKSVRPLNAPALAILSQIFRHEDTDYVFPASAGSGFYQGTKRIWDKAIKSADLEGVTPHTLRHTLGSTATSNGESLALTGAILGHANTRSTAIYAHVQYGPMKRAAERAGAHIAAALGLPPALPKRLIK
jgi:integrase